MPWMQRSSARLDVQWIAAGGLAEPARLYGDARESLGRLPSRGPADCVARIGEHEHWAVPVVRQRESRVLREIEVGHRLLMDVERVYALHREANQLRNQERVEREVGSPALLRPEMTVDHPHVGPRRDERRSCR